MRPQCRLTIDGAAASGTLMDRMISVSVTDKEGFASDTCSIKLNNHPAASIPKRGVKMRIWLGYAGGAMSFMGTFVVDGVEVSLFEHTMTISGKGADFREKMKENKERHWDNATIADIISEIAGDHGLSAKVDGAIGAFTYEWFGQQDESDMHVLKRLEERHGALFSVKDGNLVFAARGAGTNADGTALPQITVTPDNLVEGSGSIRYSDRTSYKKVTAYHQDVEKGERVELDWESPDDAQAIYKIGEPFASDKEASAAAASKGKELKRQEISFSAKILGDPTARAGCPLTFSGMEAGIDGIAFIVETATHTYSKESYTTALDGKLKV